MNQPRTGKAFPDGDKRGFDSIVLVALAAAGVGGSQAATEKAYPDTIRLPDGGRLGGQSAVQTKDFDVPTTIDDHGRRLYAVNARFGTPPTPMTRYDLVQVRKR